MGAVAPLNFSGVGAVAPLSPPNCRPFCRSVSFCFVVSFRCFAWKCKATAALSAPVCKNSLRLFSRLKRTTPRYHSTVVVRGVSGGPNLSIPQCCGGPRGFRGPSIVYTWLVRGVSLSHSWKCDWFAVQISGRHAVTWSAVRNSWSGQAYWSFSAPWRLSAPWGPKHVKDIQIPPSPHQKEPFSFFFSKLLRNVLKRMKN